MLTVVQLIIKLSHLEWKTGNSASFTVAAEDDRRYCFNAACQVKVTGHV